MLEVFFRSVTPQIQIALDDLPATTRMTKPNPLAGRNHSAVGKFGRADLGQVCELLWRWLMVSSKDLGRCWFSEVDILLTSCWHPAAEIQPRGCHISLRGRVRVFGSMIRLGNLEVYWVQLHRSLKVVNNDQIWKRAVSAVHYKGSRITVHAQRYEVQHFQDANWMHLEGRNHHDLQAAFMGVAKLIYGVPWLQKDQDGPRGSVRLR